MSGFEIPRQKRYPNEVTDTFASDRLAYLDKNAAFRRIDPSAFESGLFHLTCNMR